MTRRSGKTCCFCQIASNSPRFSGLEGLVWGGLRDGAHVNWNRVGKCGDVGMLELVSVKSVKSVDEIGG